MLRSTDKYRAGESVHSDEGSSFVEEIPLKKLISWQVVSQDNRQEYLPRRQPMVFDLPVSALNSGHNVIELMSDSPWAVRWAEIRLA